MKRFKKILLFLCLSLLTACAITHIKHLHSLTLYPYHVERTKMESLGAWHFPSKIPMNAENLTYTFNFTDEYKSMQLSFITTKPKAIKPFTDRLSDGIYSCSSSISVDPQSNLVTYTHERWLNESRPQMNHNQLAMMQQTPQ